MRYDDDASILTMILPYSRYRNGLRYRAMFVVLHSLTSFTLLFFHTSSNSVRTIGRQTDQIRLDIQARCNLTTRFHSLRTKLASFMATGKVLDSILLSRHLNPFLNLGSEVPDESLDRPGSGIT